jgi:hypothetical protein
MNIFLSILLITTCKVKVSNSSVLWKGFHDIKIVFEVLIIDGNKVAGRYHLAHTKVNLWAFDHLINSLKLMV